uniref:Uncharacterized protein n=1 Tax=Globodera rostochiensis TaxID=31243 RepID=A0A914IH33_GLORO
MNASGIFCWTANVPQMPTPTTARPLLAAPGPFIAGRRGQKKAKNGRGKIDKMDKHLANLNKQRQQKCGSQNGGKDGPAWAGQLSTTGGACRRSPSSDPDNSAPAGIVCMFFMINGTLKLSWTVSATITILNRPCRVGLSARLAAERRGVGQGWESRRKKANGDSRSAICPKKAIIAITIARS